MSSSTVIYEWQAWDGYMLPALLPDATRLEASPLDSLDQIFGRCPTELKAFAFHLNCTRTTDFPLCRDELVRRLQDRGCTVLNALVTDISKRRLQETCSFLGMPTVSTKCLEGSPGELLIVKSDLNYAGFGEKRLSPEQSKALGISLPLSPIVDVKDYRVLPRCDIPQEWWDDPMLVIERFIENPKGRKYRTYFAGTRHFISIWFDDSQIKKYTSAYAREEYMTSENILSRAEHPRLPSSFQVAVVRLVQHLRMDFGALDFVEDRNGECYAIDVNSTSYGRGVHPEARQHLRLGLIQKFDRGDASGRTPLYVPRMKSVSAYVDELISREKLNGDQYPVREQLVTAKPLESSTRTRVGPVGVKTIRAAGHYLNPGDLCVITCLFNIDGCEEKLRNFAFSIGLLQLSGIPFIVVECATHDRPWHLPPSSNVIQVRASSDLWQKERLLNCALTYIPNWCTKIAWIDGDIVFENPDWAVRASDALNKYMVVQLGERIIRLPRDRYSYSGDGQYWESFSSVYNKYPNALLLGDFGSHGHTGFGWAANRDVFDKVGFYDACVAGGGDHVMAHAFCGDWESPCLTRMMGSDSAWHRHSVAWAKRVYPLVRARVGVVGGSILHLWHGELSSRRHMQRYEALQQAQFDPDSDLSVDEFGCWRWHSAKPALHAALVEYLHIRRIESKLDTIASESTSTDPMPTGLQSNKDQAFTLDFTSPYIPTWARVLKKFAGVPGINAIEIGSYEGRSAFWFLENVLQHESSRLTCIEPCPPAAFASNLYQFRHKVRWVKASAERALRGPDFQTQSVHFVYIDGNHSAPHVLQDAILVFPLLVHGGILIFDDYLFKSRHPDRPETMPKIAIDSFISVFQDQLKILDKDYQLIVEKL